MAPTKCLLIPQATWLNRVMDTTIAGIAGDLRFMKIEKMASKRNNCIRLPLANSSK
jgi:hypothetical protein